MFRTVPAMQPKAHGLMPCTPAPSRARRGARRRQCVIPLGFEALTYVATCIYTLVRVTPKRLTNFRIDEELLSALETIRTRDGIPVSEQVRRAIELWLAEKGVSPKKPKKK